MNLWRRDQWDCRFFHFDYLIQIRWKSQWKCRHCWNHGSQITNIASLSTASVPPLPQPVGSYWLLPLPNQFPNIFSLPWGTKEKCRFANMSSSTFSSTVYLFNVSGRKVIYGFDKYVSDIWHPILGLSLRQLRIFYQTKGLIFQYWIRPAIIF